MPQIPIVFGADRTAKKPDWLNDPRTTTTAATSTSRRATRPATSRATSSGSTTSSPRSRSVVQGLARHLRQLDHAFKIDGFRIDTARHVNKAFFTLWMPKILAAAKAAGVTTSRSSARCRTERSTCRTTCARAGCRTSSTSRCRTRSPASRRRVNRGARARDRLHDDDYFEPQRRRRRRRRPSSATTTWAAPRSRSAPRRRADHRTSC